MDSQRLTVLYRVLLLIDAVTLGAAFCASFYAAPYIGWLVGERNFQLAPLNTYLWLLIVVVPAWVLMLHMNGKYLLLMLDSSIQPVMWSVIRTGFMSTALVALYLFASKNPLSRVFIATDGVLSTLLLLAEKAVARRVVRFRQEKGWDIKSILVLGTDEYAAWAIGSISEDPGKRFKVWGCLSTNGPIQQLNGVPVRGKLADYRELIWKSPIEEVLISPVVAGSRDISDIVEYCETVGLTTRIIPDFRIADAKLWERIRVEEFLGRPALTISATSPRIGLLLVKRFIDVIVSALLLILLAPLMLVIAIAVKLGSPGPIFYRWRVMGRDIKPFVSYKYRTMVVDADARKEELGAFNEMKGPAFKMRNDPRITAVGRVLRKFSLDELPQLWSVLKGDMSLVGPRPPGPHEFERFQIWHRRKLSIKPGMTCLWQVSGRNQVSNFDDWVSLDLQYIDNWSLWLDFKILALTALVVIKGTGV